MKRLLDRAAALLLLALTSPLLVVACVAIRLESSGSPIYRQRRVGKDGAPFDLYKLRTMVSGAEEMGAGLAVDEGDPRITRVGMFLRRFSLDELPNLLNVLRGEMSLVGPRPTVQEQVAQYTERQRGRLSVEPGITGWAQIKGRAALPWHERIELDLWYVENWSLRLDLTHPAVDGQASAQWQGSLPRRDGRLAPVIRPSQPTVISSGSERELRLRVSRIDPEAHPVATRPVEAPSGADPAQAHAHPFLQDAPVGTVASPAVNDEKRCAFARSHAACDGNPLAGPDAPTRGRAERRCDTRPNADRQRQRERRPQRGITAEPSLERAVERQPLVDRECPVGSGDRARERPCSARRSERLDLDGPAAERTTAGVPEGAGEPRLPPVGDVGPLDAEAERGRSSRVRANHSADALELRIEPVTRAGGLVGVAVTRDRIEGRQRTGRKPRCRAARGGDRDLAARRHPVYRQLPREQMGQGRETGVSAVRSY